MTRRPKSKRNYAAIKLEEAMQLIGRDTFTRWQLNAPPRPQSDFLKEDLRRLNVFELENSEQAKTLLIDALFAEVVPDHPKLKIWKAEALETDTLTGIADYLIAPYRAYLATPLLCVTEAKRDDFEKGRIQCLAEMYACQWNNRQRGLDIDIYGIVSNGQGWRFYKLTRTNEAYETTLYGIEDLPGLLGALDYICGECAKNVP
ncbi:MAG TPA: hypothetical protein VFB21_05315 [Chthonomonadaceae bacterium]|nr:hypothetical protein [Chthonomonadaceae bacterium]